MVDLSQYLPILIFLAIALGLSAAFVFLPMAGLEVEWTASTTLTVLGVGACGLLAALWGSDSPRRVWRVFCWCQPACSTGSLRA